jgi:hypothetical protein
MIAFAAVLPTGVMLPESVLHSDSFKIVATFVALNTVMYATLAAVKMLPRPRTPSWFEGRNRRAQDRGILVEPGRDSSR